MTFQTEEWSLKQQFLVAEMDRIDHQSYFSDTFACPDLDAFILEIHTASQAYQNKAIINMLFDRLISSGSNSRSIYVRIKWVTYMHKLMRGSRQNSVMHGLMLKAFQIYTERCEVILAKYFEQKDAQVKGRDCKTYQKYLFNTLLKPYIQYLTKLLLLPTSISVRSNDDKVDKENVKPAKLNSIEIGAQNTQCTLQALNTTTHTTKSVQFERTAESITSIEKACQSGEEQLIHWYRTYNFILSTLQHFNNKLTEVEPFFSSELPYLCNIRKYISKDLKGLLKSLQNASISLNDLSMTVIEFDELDTRVCAFSSAGMEKSIFDTNESLLCTGIDEYTKEDITNFMCSPFKPRSCFNVNKPTNSVKPTPKQDRTHNTSVGLGLVFQ